MKRAWESATTMAKKQVASLSSECAIMRMALQERENYLRAKEMECEVLQLNLAKETDLRALKEREDHLRAKAEEERKAKDLWRQIAALKTKRMELRGRIGESTEAHSRELQSAKKLMTSLTEELRKHAIELAH
ncbi:hypothetical protein AXG93_4548s1050 [Marchantia polymorpha subsp. ruderalis]|uniref:Uncharacterized protein n=1 Tax=Marchantia polymorpha subsp. ruderalis TaxID=1480154 RepID=A0A176W8J3_MARPO|nr:hypothetical protein AXG93_4548s1050 [Marchantia polymorpha subsp. ruderalis]